MATVNVSTVSEMTKRYVTPMIREIIQREIERAVNEATSKLREELYGKVGLWAVGVYEQLSQDRVGKNITLYLDMGEEKR